MKGIYTYIPETNHVPREYKCFSYSVITIYGAYTASYCVGTIVLLRQHFPKNACSAQYGCFL